MKRHLFNLLAGTSLLLCIATVALWLTSLGQGVFAGTTINLGILHIHSVNGQTELSHFPDGPWIRYWMFPSSAASPHLSDLCRWHSWGFGIDMPGASGGQYRIVIPDWCIVAVSLLLPASWMIRQRTANEKDICATCGYDLRATPDRCPECGTQVASTAERSSEG